MGDVWQALRSIVAARDGYRCCYCRVPTGATLEHVNARSAKGGHHAENLRLACPSCNSRKKDTPLSQWLESRGWELPDPGPLPGSVSALAEERYGGLSAGGYLSSGSANSRVLVREGVAYLEVRYGKAGAWQTFRLGSQEHPAVVFACFDFLRRHHTRQAIGRRGRPRVGAS